MFEERIKKGMALLTDSELDSVDIDSLDMSRGDKCMLGQILGAYNSWSHYHTDREGIENGFQLGPDEDYNAYHILTCEWQHALMVRKLNRAMDESCLWRQTVTY